MKKDALIIVRGGGDLATGTIFRSRAAAIRKGNAFYASFLRRLSSSAARNSSVLR